MRSRPLRSMPKSDMRCVHRNGPENIPAHQSRTGLLPSKEFPRGFHSRLDMELFVNVLHMCPHRAHADAQRLGNFLVMTSLGQERKDLLLAFAQLSDFRR